MCNDCSTAVSFELANRVIHPATIAKYSPVKVKTLIIKNYNLDLLASPKNFLTSLIKATFFNLLTN